MFVLFKIPDSDKFAPKVALPILVLPSQTSVLDLFTFSFDCPPLKKKCDLDCILLSEGQINTTVMLYGGNVKRIPKELMVTCCHLCVKEVWNLLWISLECLSSMIFFCYFPLIKK